MSKEIDHLLLCLSEEAGEVVQAACKAGRFGLYDSYNGVTNHERISSEINDLLGVVSALLDHGVTFPDLYDPGAILAKRLKVQKHMNYALYGEPLT